jgi:hypothetical protein
MQGFLALDGQPAKQKMRNAGNILGGGELLDFWPLDDCSTYSLPWIVMERI